MKMALSWGGWIAAIVVASLAVIGRIEMRAAGAETFRGRLSALRSMF